MTRTGLAFFGLGESLGRVRRLPRCPSATQLKDLPALRHVVNQATFETSTTCASPRDFLICVLVSQDPARVVSPAPGGNS